MVLEAATNGIKRTMKTILVDSHDIAAISDSLEKVDPVFYVDKNITAFDLREIVVCYKETTYHVGKDICVHEGVLVHDFGEV